MALFPEKKINTLVVYPFLQDLTDQEFEKAITEIITTQEEIYASTNIVALIRKKAKQVKALTAGEAWGIVKKEISSIGYWGKPKFNDSIIEKTVEIIGWRTLCVTERPSIERAQFMKIYESLVSRENDNNITINQKEINNEQRARIAETKIFKETQKKSTKDINRYVVKDVVNS